MCEFIGYEIKNELRMKKIVEDEDIEEPEFDKVKEEANTITL
jgi:hypothetical protein